jgi:steroid 5-alpha reductase family enzyme
MKQLLLALLFSVGINIFMFLPAYIFQTDKLTDLSYAITFIAIAIFGLTAAATLGAVKFVLFFMVVLWALRLGGFLFWRIRKMKKDSRFDAMRGKFFTFLRFWLLQGISVTIIMAGAILAISSDVRNFNWASIAGLAVWLSGLAIEAIADIQKYKFNQKPANKGKWIDGGLWYYSRHPNYFGEILVWIGIYLYCTTLLGGIGLLTALISPLYISTLLLFVSGVPLLEKSADARWGKIASYQLYKKQTSLIVLRPKTK